MRRARAERRLARTGRSADDEHVPDRKPPHQVIDERLPTEEHSGVVGLERCEALEGTRSNGNGSPVRGHRTVDLTVAPVVESCQHGPAPGHHGVEPLGRIGRQRTSEQVPPTSMHGRQGGHEIARQRWWRRREQSPQHRRCAIGVGCEADVAAGIELFGRLIADRSSDDAGLDTGPDILCESEVADQQPLIGTEQTEPDRRRPAGFMSRMATGAAEQQIARIHITVDIPSACSAPRPSTSASTNATTLARSGSGVASIRSSSAPRSAYSMTKYGRPSSSSPTSWIETTCSLRTRRSSLASATNRALTSLLPASFGEDLESDARVEIAIVAANDHGEPTVANEGLRLVATGAGWQGGARHDDRARFLSPTTGDVR